MTLEVALATTTWNCADIIEAFLTHYRRLGIGRAYVIDFHSTDGTLEILTSERWRPFVELAMLPSLEGQDTSNELLATIKAGFPGDWCLFCDPDEFLVTDHMTLSDLFDDANQALESIVLQRFNMTAPLVAASSEAFAADPLALLTLRVQERVPRLGADRRSPEPLVPPWIFTAILDKVLVRLDRTNELVSGDHMAHTEHPERTVTATRACLLHYPIRSYRDFLQKVQLYQLDHEANPGHPGWHQARWISVLQQGRLREEYLAQFIPNADLPGLLTNGTVTVDERVRNFHRQD